MCVFCSDIFNFLYGCHLEDINIEGYRYRDGIKVAKIPGDNREWLRRRGKKTINFRDEVTRENINNIIYCF